MATVTGDVVRDYSAQANANPWVDADFTARNSMTPIISDFAVKSNFNSAGFYSYAASTPDQSSMTIKGEIVTPSTDFSSTVGCGAVNASGNGYILWVYGNQWRIYKVNAFALEQLGDTVNLTYSAFDQIALRYEFSGGTATLTGIRNGSDEALLVRTDSSTPYNGDLEATWFFNFDNSNTNGFRSIAVDGIVSGPQIVSINSGSIVSGSAGNAMVVSSFSSPVTGLSVGGLAMNAVTNTSGDNYTFTDPGFIDGYVDPGFDELPAIASNTTETSSAFSVTRTLSASLAAVVMGTLSDDPNSIGNAAADRGLTISSTDTLYNASGLTVYEDSTISDANDGTHNIWHRDADTNVMTLIILEIVGGVIQGITARALGVSRVAMRSCSMRSLT